MEDARTVVPEPVLINPPEPVMFPERVSRVPDALVTVVLFERAITLVIVWLPSVVVIEGALLP